MVVLKFSNILLFLVCQWWASANLAFYLTEHILAKPNRKLLSLAYGFFFRQAPGTCQVCQVCQVLMLILGTCCFHVYAQKSYDTSCDMSCDMSNVKSQMSSVKYQMFVLILGTCLATVVFMSRLISHSPKIQCFLWQHHNLHHPLLWHLVFIELVPAKNQSKRII